MNSESDSEDQYHKVKPLKSFNYQENHCLIKVITSVFRNTKQPHNLLHLQKQNVLLQLRIIEKKPLYVSDDEMCIMAFKNQHQPTKVQLDPFNKLSNDFYAPHQKPEIVFNCHEQAVTEEPPMFPSPYHPAFHYKQHYQQFKLKRPKTKIMKDCRYIDVKCWSVRIVNIHNSGYYAPILILHEYKQRSNGVLDFPVQNVLFCENFVPTLEDFRLKDIRSRQTKIKLNRASFTYYMRNQTISFKNTKNSPFVSLDTKNSVLLANQNLPVKFIPIGDAREYCLFKRPVHPKYVVHTQKFSLSRYIQQNRNNENCVDSDIERFEFESSNEDDQEMGYDIGNQKQNMNDQNRMISQNQNGQSSQEQQSEGDDYLRRIYRNTVGRSS